MTKRATRYRISQHLLWMLALWLATSCSVPHYVYSPTAVQVPGLTEKHESSLDAAFSAHGVDLMGAYALTDRVAILGSWYFRHENQYLDSVSRGRDGYFDEPDSVRYLRILPSIGVSYTLPLESTHHYFLSTSAGYGKGRFRMAERDMGIHHPDTVPAAHFTSYYASLQRIYLQPAFLIKYPHVEIISSVRWSYIRFGFRHQTSLEEFGVSNLTTYSFLEGALTLRFSPPGLDWLTAQLQCGAAVPQADVFFQFHTYIGNAGISIDPVGLFRWARNKKGAPSD